MQVSTDTRRVGVGGTRPALAVRAIGPLCAVAGFAWALVQPYRITLLHPYGQGIWWLISEPPLYVVLVGLLFHWLVAPGLLDDLEEAERERSGPP